MHEQPINEVPAMLQEPRGSNLAIPFAIIIAGFAIAAAIYFGNSKTNAQQPNQAPTVFAPVTAADHILGNPKAKVIIVEYSDTECPFCKVFHQTMNDIMNEYGASGNVAWVYRQFPLSIHPKAPKEAEATECVGKLGGNEKFWQYLNKIFEVTPSNNGLNPTLLPSIAKDLGIDEAAFTACLSSGETKARIDADLASGLKAGVAGTPHSLIIVKGKIVGVIGGAQPIAAVKEAIDAALK